MAILFPLSELRIVPYTLFSKSFSLIKWEQTLPHTLCRAHDRSVWCTESWDGRYREQSYREGTSCLLETGLCRADVIAVFNVINDSFST